MRNHKFAVFFSTLISVSSVNGFDFSRINVSWQYDPLAEIQASNRITQNGDSMTVFLRFNSDELANWTFQYFVQPKYESEFHSNLKSYELDTLLSNEGSIILRLKFIKPEENLMVAKIFKEDAFYYYDVPLINGSLPYPSFYPLDEDGLPVFENFIRTSKSFWVGEDQFYASEYAENFGFADPPMADMKLLAPSISPDTSFVFSGFPPFKDNFFYNVRSDSNASIGITILKTSPYFPQLRLLGELADAMTYILNEPERKALGASKNLKESFDSFWINTFTTKFRARNAIRNYYNSVEQANKVFTDFKQGWKTDRGMLLIVYGAPDEVYRTGSEEEWYYDLGAAFEFTIISTFFSPKTYALRRRIEHEASWFEFIASIRRGAE